MTTNPGCDLDFDWVHRATVNTWSVYDKEKNISEQCYKFDEKFKTAWLLRAVSCLDLTTLAGDDTYSNVSRLCHKAASPISEKILNKLQFNVEPFTTAAICVYPSRIENAVSTIEKISFCDQLNIAAVCTGFPSGQYHIASRLQEIKHCISEGANEVDVVIDRSLVLTAQWNLLYQELKKMKQVCGNNVKMKTILAVGELANFRNIYKASLVAMMAGSDFIKTSTGKEAINATFPVGLVMMRAIQDYYCRTSYKVGFKAAGGIKTSNDALNWMSLVKNELGKEWLNKSLFRIGASSLLQDIEKELYMLAFNIKPAHNEFTLV